MATRTTVPRKKSAQKKPASKANTGKTLESMLRDHGVITDPPASSKPEGCTCTITSHERMENSGCPVHFQHRPSELFSAISDLEECRHCILDIWSSLEELAA